MVTAGPPAACDGTGSPNVEPSGSRILVRRSAPFRVLPGRGGAAAPELLTLLSQLAPGARMARPGDGASSGPAQRAASYAVLPDVSRPRLLVPLDDRRAAAAAIGSRFDRSTSPVLQAARTLARAGLRSGALPRLAGDRLDVLRTGGRLPAPLLADHLAAIYEQPVLLTGSVRRRDPHQSQVLQVLSLQGRTLGFAKIARNDLTRALLAAEREALARSATARMPTVRAPEIVDFSVWNGLEVLVTSVLPLLPDAVSSRREPPPVQVTEEIASSGHPWSGPLADSPYWAAVRERAELVGSAAGPGPAADLAEALHRLGGLGAAPVRLGGWHGDWVPWNFSSAGDTLNVWDWEYAGPAVPVGFDLLHFHCGVAFFRDQLPLGPALFLAQGRARGALRQLGLDEGGARLVTALFGIESMLRRLEISAAGGGTDDRRVYPEIGPAVTAVARMAVTTATP